MSSRVIRSAHRYTFLSQWDLPVAPGAAYAVLADLWSYPHWWPEFTRADKLTDDHGTFALRSALPLTLNFTLTRDVDDEERGLLRATAAGDITGTVQWHLTPTDPAQTTAQFTQHVTLNHRLARRLGFALRPALTWNHDTAMRSGCRGLVTMLSENPANPPPVPAASPHDDRALSRRRPPGSRSAARVHSQPS